MRHKTTSAGINKWELREYKLPLVVTTCGSPCSLIVDSNNRPHIILYYNINTVISVSWGS